MKPPFKLETDRLYLREHSILDSDFMLQLMNTPSWLSFIGDRNIRYKTAAIPLNGISLRLSGA
jgi:hypothetical protein